MRNGVRLWRQQERPMRCGQHNANDHDADAHPLSWTAHHQGRMRRRVLCHFGYQGKSALVRSARVRSAGCVYCNYVVARNGSNFFSSFFFFIYSGHNTDGKYFINSNRMSFHFETTPKRIVLFIEKSKDGHVTPIDGVQIVDFSCGNNHSVRVPPHPRFLSIKF